MGTLAKLLKRLARLRRPRELSPAEGYRRWAAAYGREPNAFQKLEAPALERLLPDVAGRRVLDLGCGRGRVSRRVLELGAARAVACDLAPAMLGDAGTFQGSSRHRVAASAGALPFAPASFDAVVCALVLGHVADLASALAAIAGVLRPGGCLLISDFHPFATLRGWERTFVDRGETCAVEQHLHLLSDYLEAFARCGLATEALEEPRWRGFPVVFVLRARKKAAKIFP